MPTSWSLFEEPYWLDAVAPGAWRAAEVRDREEIVGRLPYVVKRKLGVSALTVPVLTPWLGPWIKEKDGKYCNTLSYQHQILQELLAQLPASPYQAIHCAPQFTNLMALSWAGFDLRFRYTYRITDLSDPDAIWRGFRENIRRECRKAERNLEVRTDLSLSRLLDSMAKTFDRQALNRDFLKEPLQRIDRVMNERGQRQIYFAVDAQERIHAAIYVVWDPRCAFYLAGGGDPELRSSGAHSLLVWRAIKDSAEVSKEFDFEGSMVAPIERFFRAFNAQQVPCYSAHKRALWMRLVDSLRTSRG